MRIALALLASVPLFAFATVQAADFPVLPETPSGQGDPDAMVCRAPQALPASGALGPKICMHNNVWLRLTMTGQDLSADGKSVFARPTVDEPNGAGNPDAVTCRKPVALTASRVKHGPEVCLTNRYWAELGAQQKRIAIDGQVVSSRINGAGGTGPDGIPIVAANISPAL
ncbi:MAG: hypothetical protein JWP16_434 [Alphaproteobacteria bacterium]|nr:hypothetical protein [Alphaproteobacteria bacterium]